MGGFTVKLLKLHGSLNWLQCSRCMRLYAKFYKKVAVSANKNKISCRHCDENFPEHKRKHIISSNLIMPTYIKDLSNPQYKIIWQNAGIEISEAEKLVFIGYSLPSADFEMRQLLSRMTRKNAEIVVVDKQKKSADQGRIKAQWETFFGSRDVKLHFEGATRYIESL
jgi:NAD-dependent SIR2 family protein deacetylase